MEQRILVPLDGSEVGEAVLIKIKELVLGSTPRMDTQVTLLQVISKMNYNMLTDNDAAQLPYDESEVKELTQKSQAYLDKVAASLNSTGIEVQTMVSFGHAAEEIVKAAHAIKANLIAMSTHSRNGFVRWAIGSVTDRVLRLEGKIPVLAVRAQNKEAESPVLPMESLHSLMKHS
jgi:nucleotide-binding universal stress UspA family protein